MIYVFIYNVSFQLLQVAVMFQTASSGVVLHPSLKTSQGNCIEVILYVFCTGRNK